MATTAAIVIPKKAIALIAVAFIKTIVATTAKATIITAAEYCVHYLCCVIWSNLFQHFQDV